MRKTFMGIIIGAAGMFAIETAIVVLNPRLISHPFPGITTTLHSAASDELTLEVAQAALDQAPLGGGTAKALTVNAVPVFGVTQVDVQIVNCRFVNLAWSAGQRTWSGRGQAFFQHNTDGSWVLKTVRNDVDPPDDFVINTNILVR